MFYIVAYLTKSDLIANCGGAAYIQSLMARLHDHRPVFHCLMLYANNFVMKRRRRELGLYHVLGMEKRHSAHLLFWETFLCALAAIAGGLTAGILFSNWCFCCCCA